jgi:dephospho-CoA kinase
MLRVGLTGGIGSGKSTVAAIFDVLGIPVTYADREARLAMQEDPELREQLIGYFGEKTFVNGMLNRAYLAEQVFTDPAKLERLNALVHPVTLRASEKWMRDQEGKAPYIIKEAALIFESRAAGCLDYVIGVHAPTPLRVLHTMQRDHITREEVLQRMNNQISEEIKMKLCDAVIENDGLHALIPQVLELHEKLRRLAAAPTSVSPARP